jgi:DNA-binding MarR family transcriptional regulator
MGKATTSAEFLGGLTPAEGRAWSAFLRAHAEVLGEMSADLDRGPGLALTGYDVLRQLALAPGGQLRMSELADRVLLSRPGLTGVANRLEANGLIRRKPCESDGRGMNAVLTARGRRRLLEAHPTHLRSIRERFARCFDDEELAMLAELLGRLSDRGPTAGEDA